MTVCLPTEDGIPYVQWINYIFGDCVYGTQAAISTLLGYASILFWLNAQLPQVITNYRAGSTDGLSLNFLAIWLAGDSTNLIGSILTHQLPFQIYLGTYFVFIDLCLLSQWMYYKNKNKHQDEYVIIPSSTSTTVVAENDATYTDSYNNTNSILSLQHPTYKNIPVQHYYYLPSTANHTASTVNYAVTESTPFSSSASPSKWYTLSITPLAHTKDGNITDSDVESDSQSVQTTNHNHSNTAKLLSILFFSTYYFIPNANTLTTAAASSMSSSDQSFSVATIMDDNSLLWLGRVIAWICTCLYLTSRIPQLLKNHYRQSVEGLSISLFIFAALGNLTYASSVLLHPHQTLASLMEALPFLIGSVGTLIFDFSIFSQFIWYMYQKKKRESNRLCNKQITV